MKKLLFGQIYKTDKYNLIVACGENKKPIRLLFTEAEINKARERAEKNTDEPLDIETKHIEIEHFEEKLKQKENSICLLTNEVAIAYSKLKKNLDHCALLQNEIKELSLVAKHGKYCSWICLALGIIVTICSYFIFFV